VPTDQLSLTFAALADPTRRSILTRLAEGEATVNVVPDPYPVSLPPLSRHLKVLVRAGRGFGMHADEPERPPATTETLP
jgi:DNA-binding transcriptional ArsR family regulator